MVASQKPEKPERRRAAGRRTGDDDPSARIAMLVITEMRASRKVHSQTLDALRELHASVLRVEAHLGAQASLRQLRREISDAGTELESIRLAREAHERKTG